MNKAPAEKTIVRRESEDYREVRVERVDRLRYRAHGANGQPWTSGWAMGF